MGFYNIRKINNKQMEKTKSLPKERLQPLYVSSENKKAVFLAAIQQGFKTSSQFLDDLLNKNDSIINAKKLLK